MATGGLTLFLTWGLVFLTTRDFLVTTLFLTIVLIFFATLVLLLLLLAMKRHKSHICSRAWLQFCWIVWQTAFIVYMCKCCSARCSGSRVYVCIYLHFSHLTSASYSENTGLHYTELVSRGVRGLVPRLKHHSKHLVFISRKWLKFLPPSLGHRVWPQICKDLQSTFTPWHCARGSEEPWGTLSLKVLTWWCSENKSKAWKNFDFQNPEPPLTFFGT